MITIDDRRFVSTMSRRFCGESRLLTGCTIHVTDYGSDTAGLSVGLSNGFCFVILISWMNRRADVLPGSSLLTARDLFDCALEDAFTEFIGRFLRKHHFIDAHGCSTRRRLA